MNDFDYDISQAFYDGQLDGTIDAALKVLEVLRLMRWDRAVLTHDAWLECMKDRPDPGAAERWAGIRHHEMMLASLEQRIIDKLGVSSVLELV